MSQKASTVLGAILRHLMLTKNTESEWEWGCKWNVLFKYDRWQ